MGLQDLHLEYLDIVALGTIADIVPLIDENRVIVKYGLEKIINTKNIGLKALINISNTNGKPIDSFFISYIIAPRINAAGRIGSARRAVELLVTDNADDAILLATELNNENQKRQYIEQEILKQVIEIIEKEIDIENTKIIVVSGENWHHGVIGIVCSKITEKYYRPCILLSNEAGKCIGSGRSIKEFNILKALCHCSCLLEKFGGHELAVGLTIKSDSIEQFKDMIENYAKILLLAKHLRFDY